MAKYTVRKGDNPLKLATQWGISPQKLLQSNGIQSLTAGQTIKIPSGNATGTLGFRSNNPVAFNGLNVPSSFPTTSNYPYIPPASAPLPMPNFMTQAMLPPAPLTQQQILQATNGGTTPALTSPQMALGANTYIPPNTGIPQNQTITPNQNTSPDLSNMTYSNGQSLFNPNNPNNSSAAGAAVAGKLNTSVPYGSNPDNDKAWRAAWNIQAGGTGDEQVRLLSREDVWNRKANQRRKQGGGGVVPVVTSESVTGNASNTSLSWRVG